VRKILLTTGILALALAVGAPAAEREDVKSNLVLHELTPNRAIGVVLSPEKACQDERAIFLFRLVGGGQPTERVAIGKTSPKGHWVIHQALAPGEYYATTPNQRRGDFDCRHDLSPRRSLPAPTG
jgi:hypothetical protein